MVENIKVNGIDVKSELDNTILKVYLPKTLISGKYKVFNEFLKHI